MPDKPQFKILSATPGAVTPGLVFLMVDATPDVIEQLAAGQVYQLAPAQPAPRDAVLDPWAVGP